MQFLRSRWFYFWIAIIGLPIAWWFWGTGWVAERRWQAYLAESRARGVKWEKADYRLPIASPEDDLLRLPVFADAEKWNAVFEKLPIRANGRSTEESMREMDWDKILEGILRGKRASAVGANEKLRACDETLKPLQEVIDMLIASRAENANWPDYWASRTQVDVAVYCIRLLWLRAQLDLAMNRPDAARQKLDTLMRIARAHQKTPSGSRPYLADESIRMARHLVATGLELGNLPDDLLRHWIEQYSNTDHFQVLVRLLGWARASSFEWVEEEVSDVTSSMRSMQWRGGGESMIRDLGRRLSMSRRAWWRIKQLRLEQSRDELLSMIDVEHQRWIPRERMVVPEAGDYSAYDFDVTAVDDCWKTARRTNFDQAMDRMAALACGLELHRRKTGDYPASLEQLVPDYLTSLPHDPASGHSFVYRRQYDGSYVLYSIGFDGIDQGGSSVRTSHRMEMEMDWIWQSQLLKSDAQSR